MKNTYKILNLLILTMLVMNACHPSGNKESVEETGDTPAMENQTILITEAQFTISKMKLGTEQLRTFDQVINVSGYVKTSADGSSSLSTFIPGMVASIYVESGDRVEKGSPLFDLTGNDVLQLQQDYLESLFELNALEADYLRQKQLSEVSITAQKTFEAAERDYMVMKTRVQSLKLKLSLLQINADQLENGQLQKKITISAPIPGIVTDMNITSGQQCEAGDKLLSIINPGSFRLELHVFEKDINMLESGQEVRVNGKNGYLEPVHAKLATIGRNVNKESRIVNCYAELPVKDRTAFLNNQFVEAEIITCMREVKAIPDQSLVVEDERYYVLVLDRKEGENYYFRKVRVDIGVIQKGYAELLQDVPGEILVEGGYNLNVE